MYSVLFVDDLDCIIETLRLATATNTKVRPVLVRANDSTGL